MSEFLNLILYKWIVPITMIPTLLTFLVNYYIRGIGNEAFVFPVPISQVFHISVFIKRTKESQIQTSSLFSNYCFEGCHSTRKRHWAILLCYLTRLLWTTLCFQHTCPSLHFSQHHAGCLLQSFKTYQEISPY